MTAPLAEAAVVSRRLDLPCTVVGFEPPPCRVHLRVLHVGPRWSLLVRTVPGRAPSIAKWVEAHRPVSVSIADGIAPAFLRADFRDLPAHWRWMTLARVHHVDLSPDGMASVFAQGSLSEVERLLEWTRQTPHPVRERPVRAGPEPELTPRQFEALSAAVALGYYEIPHRIDLRALAQKIGISVGSVSALLRRAEAAVITTYVDTRSQRRWEPESVPAPSPGPGATGLGAEGHGDLAGRGGAGRAADGVPLHADAEPQNLTRPRLPPSWPATR